MRLFFHAGAHKTGSTAVQRSFHENRGMLAERGLHWFSESANHGDFLRSAYCLTPEEAEARAATAGSRVRRIARAKAGPDALRARLRKELKKARDAGARSFIISAEVATTIFDEPALERLKEDVEDLVDEIRVLVYLRDPAGYAVSMAQQKVKGGARLGKLKRRAPVQDLRKAAERFETVLGEGVLELRAYHPDVLVDGDAIADFWDALGETGPMPAALRLPDRPNSSLTQLAVEVLDAAYREADEGGARVTFPFRKLLREVGGQRFALPQGAIEDVEERGRADLEWFEARTGRPFPPARPPSQRPKREARDDELRSLARLLLELAAVRQLAGEQAAPAGESPRLADFRRAVARVRAAAMTRLSRLLRGPETAEEDVHPVLRAHPGLKGCLFVVTYGRSGSTLLKRLLGTIPGAVLRGENENALLHLFRSVNSTVRTVARYGGAEKPERHPWHGAELIDSAAYGRDLAAAFVTNVLAPAPDTRWIGFKEIRYAQLNEQEMRRLIEFILDAFPNAHVVCSTRDHEDVLKSGWWPESDLEKTRRQLETCDRVFAALAAERQDRVALVRYEDFARDPEALGPLFARLGEPLDAEAAKEVLADRLRH